MGTTSAPRHLPTIPPPLPEKECALWGIPSRGRCGKTQLFWGCPHYSYIPGFGHCLLRIHFDFQAAAFFRPKSLARLGKGARGEGYPPTLEHVSIRPSIAQTVRAIPRGTPSKIPPGWGEFPKLSIKAKLRSSKGAHADRLATSTTLAKAAASSTASWESILRFSPTLAFRSNPASWL